MAADNTSPDSSVQGQSASGTTGGMVAQASRSRSFRFSDVEPYIFLLPFLLTFVAFMIGPFIWMLYMSLTDWVGILDPEFIGLENYDRMFFKDRVFWIAFLNNIWFAVGAVLLVIPFAMGIALILNWQALPAKPIFRTLFFLPIATSAAVVSVIFANIFGREYGIVNFIFGNFGIGVIDWFSDPVAIKPAIMTLIVWRWSALFMIYLLAGLQGISNEYYEAAKVDGANALQSFFNVTIPLLRPVLVFVLVIVTHDSLRVFEEPFILTRFTSEGDAAAGGPEDSALTLSLYLYRHGFLWGKLGYGSAVSFFIFALTMIVAFVQIKRLRGLFAH